MEPPFGEDLSAKAEESLLLQPITREQLVNTQQGGKAIASAVVI
jgi:hypothetical protein